MYYGRPSVEYQIAIQKIAKKDEPHMEYDHMIGKFSVELVARIFHLDPVRVAVDVMNYRRYLETLDR